MGAGAQTEPGAERKDGKGRENIPCRAVSPNEEQGFARPEGMEERLGKPLCAAEPAPRRKARGEGVQLMLLVSPGGRDLLAVAPRRRFP